MQVCYWLFIICFQFNFHQHSGFCPIVSFWQFIYIFIFFQVKAFFQLGSYTNNTESKSCVVVGKEFFLGKVYVPRVINSLLKTAGEGLGKSQSRIINGISSQAVLVNMAAFTNEQQLKLTTGNH